MMAILAGAAISRARLWSGLRLEASRMNRIEKLRSNIETLKDSLAVDWSDLALPLTGEQRVEIENHLEWCLTEMDWCLLC
jgi:hypothetical protein